MRSLNKYSKWYNLIIQSRRQNPFEGYTESHHIKPKSLGGDDLKENLVELSAREHFVCHLLLTKMYPENPLATKKMILAWCWMAWGKNSNLQERSYKINSHLFKKLREKHSAFMGDFQSGESNSQHGTVWISKESKEENKKVKLKDLNEYLEEGWAKGRVLNWEKHKSKKKSGGKRGDDGVVFFERVCENCQCHFSTKSFRAKGCSKKCSNKIKYKNSKPIKITRQGEVKEIKPQSFNSYKKLGWKKQKLS